MPLLRFDLRNEYGLGHPQLYADLHSEDPKALFDGVAVSGLVGILRQLGDLAEFAAEIFHGLQDEVTNTASRSHKLMIRVQNIEAAVTPLEKAVLAQTSHIHFAYTAGHEWHPRVPNEQNHFIYNDLPRFIMDSYEDCRDPARLHLLDKFDKDGPGSCLKRYSDPTFFKKASGRTIDATNGIKRHKKKPGIKKKMSLECDGDMTNAAAISNENNRMQCCSLSFSGRTSSGAASAVDMVLRSDFHDRSYSFDSRNGRHSFEHVVNLSPSMEPEEKMSKQSCLRLMSHSDTIASVTSDSLSEGTNYNLLRCPSEEQVSTRSSSFTWDKKAKMVESPFPDRLERNSEPDTHESEAPDVRTAEKMVNPSEDTNFSKRDVESEQEIDSETDLDSDPDKYMDALNTIESESENELWYRTKGVEQHPSNVERDIVEGVAVHEHKGVAPVREPMGRNRDQDCSVVTHATPDTLMAEVISSSPREPVSEIFLDEWMPPSPTSDHPVGTEVCADCVPQDESKEESVATHLPSSVCVPRVLDSQKPFSNVIINNVHEFHESHADLRLGPDSCLVGQSQNDSTRESTVKHQFPSMPGSGTSDSQTPFSGKVPDDIPKLQESDAETSSLQSVKTWTNGSLLGLEPSKPPLSAVNSSVIEDIATKKADEVGEQFKSSQLFQKVGSSRSVKAPYQFADLGSGCERSSNSLEANGPSQANKTALAKISMMATETRDQDVKDLSTASLQSWRENDELLSGEFGLSHRLLVNGFCGKVPGLLASTPKSELTDRRENNQKHHDLTFNFPYGHDTPFSSLTSSPPLEHMKISFNPGDSFQCSKLRLKIPDEGSYDEKNRDMLSSFQLIPEPATSTQDTFTDSDEDDDTFCRSSPCDSDKCPFDHSEWNSERWGCEESPERMNHQLCDTLHKLSDMEIVSSSLHNATAINGIRARTGHKHTDAMYNVNPPLSIPIVDLPSFDAVTAASRMETKDCFESKNTLYPQTSPEPMPPPLPPAQWRVSKTSSEGLEERQSMLQDALGRSFKCDATGGSRRLRAVINEKQAISPLAIHKPESKVQPEKNVKKDADQAAKGKDSDEMGDFLHQIRTKQFNLRRTVTAKPSLTTGPTNANINAILEKANAIRQAVASDDGEDSWSDT